MRLVMAKEMSEDPFGQFRFDGVLGLGLTPLTLTPEYSFFGQFIAQHPAMRPLFAVFIARDDTSRSVISLGGFEQERAGSEVQWTPVAMQEHGHWMVQIKNVRIGDQVMEECADGSCRAILDTGASLFSVPRPFLRSMQSKLARLVPDELYGDVESIDCRGIPGHALEFDLGGAVVTLTHEDYARPAPFNMTMTNSTEAKLVCRSLLMPVDLGPPIGPHVFIFGEPVLRSYYTIFDFENRKVGFSKATALASDEGAGLPPVDAPPPGSVAVGAPLPPMKRRAVV